MQRTGDDKVSLRKKRLEFSTYSFISYFCKKRGNSIIELKRMRPLQYSNKRFRFGLAGVYHKFFREELYFVFFIGCFSLAQRGKFSNKDSNIKLNFSNSYFKGTWNISCELLEIVNKSSSELMEALHKDRWSNFSM